MKFEYTLEKYIEDRIQYLETTFQVKKDLNDMTEQSIEYRKLLALQKFLQVWSNT